IRDDIAQLPGITQVDLVGARRDEISIEVSEESLRRHQLTFDQVVQAMRRSSLDLPGGSIRTLDGEVLLRTQGQAYTGPEFEDIVVVTRSDGTRLMLSDVATIRDGFEEDDRHLRFDGAPSMMIAVYQVGEQRVLDLVDSVKAYVQQAQAELPPGFSLTVWRDSSQSLRDRLDILIRNGFQGFVLVFVLLSLFLRLRLAVWVSLGVPIAFFGALALFPVLGTSINLATLFAFILVLGLLVDDAIVVGENVHTHQERNEDPLSAAISGTQEVSVPVIFGVLTTVAAFLPLVLAPGMMGQMFGQIGVVVMICLFVSLVESQLILPSHLGHLRIQAQGVDSPHGGVRGGWKKFQDVMAGSLVGFAQRVYRPALEWALTWRYAMLAGGVVLLAWTLTLVGIGKVPFTFMPSVESDYVKAFVSMPIGTHISRTEEAVARIEEAAFRVQLRLNQEYPDLDEPLVQHVLSMVGGRAGRSSSGAPGVSGASHLGEVSVELVGGQNRPIDASDVVRAWRDEIPELVGIESLSFKSALFSAGESIALRLGSPDSIDLERASDELKRQLSRYPGVFDIEDTYEDGKREIKLSILPAAETLGLTLEDLARQVRQAFYGVEAQRIQRGRDDVRVMVRFPEDQRTAIGDLERMRIRTPDGAEVPFYTVARIESGRGFSTIRRTNRERVITVSADVDERVANPNEIMTDLFDDFLPTLLANHPGLQVALEGEQREQALMGDGMIRLGILSLLIIYILLAVPLRSYGQPVIIMAVIPFGLVGAIGGHLLLDKPLSMMSLMGVAALSGVVVNASLVLVHHVNARRAEGVDIREAVKMAGVARFRPIVLTSLTTFAGLTPLLLERSLSAQFLIPMAISLAFGVAFATLITLLLVPCGYLVLDDFRRASRKSSRRNPADHSPLVPGASEPPVSAQSPVAPMRLAKEPDAPTNARG
ncbi:MAG: efflux RND transporter permease subunit, partial [Myxococcota bacterium]|nr:efflux RND transporter permease subunit [Myxococcota bacterium]